MQKKSNYKPLVPAVEHASQVLLCLGAGDKFNKRLTEIYKQVGIHKSKAYTILNTLMKFGFVEKDAQMKTYSLGPCLILLSRYFLDNLNYMEVVSPFIAALAKETNGTALFGMVSGEHVFIVEKYEGNQNVAFTLRIGHRFHITLGSHGKSILAFMPDEKREKILARKELYFYGDPASLDLKRLRNELEECRRKGYASDIGEITPGISFVSAPVFGLNKKIIGCVILIGTFSGHMVEEVGAKTAYTGRQISHRLGADLKNIYMDQS
ncbi:MAG: IclR family transcriptional regulator [Dehalococcoidia bacterium]|nr:IclR family transcriptional regulator [Dehalococcoidia bacterium]